MPGRRRIIWDDELPGYGLRIEPSGIKVFILLYRPGSGRRKAPRRFVKIVRYGVITPDEARAAAKRLLGEVARGNDPASERAANRNEMTVADLLWLYEAESRFPGRPSALCIPHPCGPGSRRGRTVDFPARNPRPVGPGSQWNGPDRAGQLIDTVPEWQRERQRCLGPDAKLAPEANLTRRGVSVLFVHHAGTNGRQRGRLVEKTCSIRSSPCGDPKITLRTRVHGSRFISRSSGTGSANLVSRSRPVRSRCLRRTVAPESRGPAAPALPRAEAATLECRLSFSPGVLPGEPEVIRQGLSRTAQGTGGTGRVVSTTGSTSWYHPKRRHNLCSNTVTPVPPHARYSAR
jgi:hypothetical protein